MANKTMRLEAAGWGFWACATAVLLGPCIYLAARLVEDHYTWDVLAGIGFVFATLSSAVITLIVNTILQRNAARRRAAEKKPARKKK